MNREEIKVRLALLDSESAKLIQEHNKGCRLKQTAATPVEEAEATLEIDRVARQLKATFDEIRRLNFQLDSINQQDSSGGPC